MVNHEVAELNEATRTRAGMTVNAKLEKQQHRTNLTRSTEECASVNLEPHTFYRGLRDDFTVRSAGFSAYTAINLEIARVLFPPIISRLIVRPL